jgi:hypothetical protein
MGRVGPVIRPICKRDGDAFELFQRVRTREGRGSVEGVTLCELGWDVSRLLIYDVFWPVERHGYSG